MEFGAVGRIVWLLSCIFLGLLWVFSGKLKKYLLNKIGDGDLILKFSGDFSYTQIFVRRLLLFMAVIFLCVGIMDLRKLVGMRKMDVLGLNMVIALDVSESMWAQDLKPNRLTRAKMEISSLVDKLATDKISLVIFSGQAMVFCPLTVDYSAFKEFLDSVEVGMVPVAGTNISDALKKAMDVLASAEGNKVILLITDGEDFHRNDTIKLARQCQKKGIKIYTIGIGTQRGEPIPLPEGGFKKDKEGKIVLTRLDEDLLIKISQITSGAYLRAGGGRVDVEKMYDLILKEIRDTMQNTNVPDYKRYYPLFGWAAFFLLIISWFIPMNWAIGSTTGKYITGVLLFFVSFVVSCAWSPLYLKNNSAVSKAKQGDIGGAKEDLESLQKKMPADPVVNYNMGKIAVGEKKDPTAYYQVATLSGPDELRKRAFYNLGNFLMNQGKLKEAIENYKQALLLDPDFVDARYNLELALKKLSSQKMQNRKNEENEDNSSKQDQKKQNEKGGSQDSEKDRNKTNSSQNMLKENKSKDTKSSQDKSSLGQSSQGNAHRNKEQKAGQNKESKQNRSQQENSQRNSSKRGKSSDSDVAEDKKDKQKNKDFGSGEDTAQHNSSDQKDKNQLNTDTSNKEGENSMNMVETMISIGDEEISVKDMLKYRIKKKQVTFQEGDKDW